MHRLLCYNLYSPRPDDARRERVLATIRECNADLMGFQEITPTWKEILEEHFSTDYAFLGNPREEGRDCEYAPVLFRREKYECIEWKTFWLSDTPEVQSRFEESKYYRICTIAEMREKKTGTEFLLSSVHMDYVWAAAEKQARVLLRLLDQAPGLPIAMCGDFNCNRFSPAYAILGQSRLRNAEELAEITEIRPTFQAFGKKEDTIDFVWVDGMKVHGFYVPEIKVDGLYPSDHNPLICDLNW